MRSAAVLLLAAVLAAAGASVFAQSNNNTITATENDVRALNYMLALENLQLSFFEQGLGNLTAEDFVLAGYNESVYTELKTMQQQHIIHNNWIRAVIRARNGTAVEPCVYNFTSLFTTVPSDSNDTSSNSTSTGNNTMIIQPKTFIETAMRLHTLTTDAIVGVIGRLSDPGLVETVASLVVVEGQHGAYLAIVQNEEPFPQPFVDSLTPENVTSVALPFTEDCPFDSLPLPFNRTDVNACSNTTVIVVPTDGPTTNPSATPTTTGPTGTQSAASSISVSSALVVTLLATIIAAAAHVVAL